MDFEQVISNIRINNLNWYNFYNADIDPDTHFITQYYNSHKSDNVEIDQKISVLYLDIEVWHDDRTRSFDFKTGEFPISAITICMDNCYYSYIYLAPINADKFGISGNMSPIDFQNEISSIEQTFTKYLITNKYIGEESSIKVAAFANELSMITACWDKIKELGPLVLTGWNSDTFDFPYIYNRLLQIGDKKLANKTMSELGFVSFNNGLLKIPDYSIFDLLHAYKPRAEGGLNYGDTLASYSLDFVSNIELNGLKKIQYKGEYGDLNQLYEKDPKAYLLYNIADVILCVKLDDRLKHIELHNGVRRRVKCGFSKAMIGSSALYDTFVYNQLSNNGKMIRNGIVGEKQKMFSKEDFDHIPKPVFKKKQLEAGPIAQRDFSKISCKFDGAYVTQSQARIIKGNKLVLDLDAASLYPSMMLQSNISFDSYVARVIPTTTYKLLAFLEQSVGKNSLPQSLLVNLFELINNFVNVKDISPKQRNIRDYYFSTSYMLTKIFESGIPMENIYNPKNNQERILLQQYLMPVLDIMNNIHPEREAYNDFVYDYVFGGDLKKYPKIYIFKNSASSACFIDVVNVEDAIKYISKYSLTVSGACFYKHEDKLGLFTEMLQDFGALRKSYRDESAKHDKGSIAYELYNSKQLSVKVLMNSVYGIFGLSSYRYSNHILAHAITTQGRTTIKVAQHLAEKYLSQQHEMNSN